MRHIGRLAGVAVYVAFGLTGSAEAQHHHHSQNYGHSNYYVPQYVQPQHGHDAAGHRVDAYNHHINNYGQHTGSVGVYDGNVGVNALPYTTNYPVQSAMIPGYGLPIKIVNPAASGNVITYTLNGFQYAIRPGESQSLVNDRAWVIQFDRGGEFGSARYSLNPGNYEFTPSVNGWEIFHESPQVVQANNVMMTNPAMNRLPSNPVPTLPNSAAPAPATFVPTK